MTKLIHAFYNMDTNSVELTYNDGSVLTIDCEEVENHYDVTNGQMADLDWLLYNAAMEYASALYFGCTKATLILYKKEFEGGFMLPTFYTATFILDFTIFLHTFPVLLDFHVCLC